MHSKGQETLHAISINFVSLDIRVSGKEKDISNICGVQPYKQLARSST
jgi:hypothetical protein